MAKYNETTIKYLRQYFYMHTKKYNTVEDKLKWLNNFKTRSTYVQMLSLLAFIQNSNDKATISPGSFGASLNTMYDDYVCSVERSKEHIWFSEEELERLENEEED